jgi:hypothetical protein
LDPFNNVDFNYRGTVHFTTTDASPESVLPADVTFTSADAGVHTFSAGVTLITAGSQAVTVADTISGISGTSAVTVTAATPDHLLVAASDTVTSGIPFDVTVTIQDAFNNTVMTYLGTVQVMSTDTDPAVILPPDYPFTSTDAGVHTFSGGVTLITVGVQTITVSDPSLAISGGVTVNVMPGGLPPSPGDGPKGPAGGLFPDVIGILDAVPFAPRPWVVFLEGIPLSNGARKCINLFRVHDLIIALEQPGDRRFVNFHLGVADADGAITDDPVAFSTLVHRINPFDAERWNSVQVDRQAQTWGRAAGGARQ